MRYPPYQAMNLAAINQTFRVDAFWSFAHPAIY